MLIYKAKGKSGNDFGSSHTLFVPVVTTSATDHLANGGCLTLV